MVGIFIPAINHLLGEHPGDGMIQVFTNSWDCSPGSALQIFFERFSQDWEVCHPFEPLLDHHSIINIGISKQL
jgi:hypothetical protein